jgi:hypothetical protein
LVCYYIVTIFFSKMSDRFAKAREAREMKRQRRLREKEEREETEESEEREGSTPAAAVVVDSPPAAVAAAAPHAENIISIRYADGWDFNQWFTLWEGYLEFYKTPLNLSLVETTWTRLLSREEPMHCLVAVKGEKLLGMAHFIR